MGGCSNWEGNPGAEWRGWGGGTIPRACPTAVFYRKGCEVRKPKTFSFGLVTEDVTRTGAHCTANDLGAGQFAPTQAHPWPGTVGAPIGHSHALTGRDVASRSAR